MNDNVDPTHQREFELGCTFGEALRQNPFTDTKARRALLLDVLGDDQTLLAPLRYLIEAPSFPELMNEPLAAARSARKEALLHELSSWCNEKTLIRLGAFLSGAINTPPLGHIHSSPYQEDPKPAVGSAGESGTRTELWQPHELPSSVEPSAASSPALNNDVHSAGQLIALLCEQARSASLTSDHHHAIELLSEALRIDPSRPDLYMLRGCQHLKNQDPGFAAQDFTSVLRLEPEKHEARARRGQAYALTGAIKKAEEDWQLAESAGSSLGKQWYLESALEKAMHLFLCGNEDEALDVLDQLIFLGPEDPKIFCAIGQIKQQFTELYISPSGKDEQMVLWHDSAISDFSSAIKLDPDHASSLALRGKSFKAKGDADSARLDWERASTLGSEESLKWLKELQSTRTPERQCRITGTLD